MLRWLKGEDEMNKLRGEVWFSGRAIPVEVEIAFSWPDGVPKVIVHVPHDDFATVPVPTALVEFVTDLLHSARPLKASRKTNVLEWKAKYGQPEAGKDKEQIIPLMPHHKIVGYADDIERLTKLIMEYVNLQRKVATEPANAGIEKAEYAMQEKYAQGGFRESVPGVSGPILMEDEESEETERPDSAERYYPIKKKGLGGNKQLVRQYGSDGTVYTGYGFWSKGEFIRDGLGVLIDPSREVHYRGEFIGGDLDTGWIQFNDGRVTSIAEGNAVKEIGLFLDLARKADKLARQMFEEAEKELCKLYPRSFQADTRD